VRRPNGQEACRPNNRQNATATSSPAPTLVRFLAPNLPFHLFWGGRGAILVDRTFNEHRAPRGAILPETEALLKAFYAPFNQRLAGLLGPGGASGLLRAAGDVAGQSEGDVGAARFTWEDVWLTHR
jgi:hypothetical protein